MVFFIVIDWVGRIVCFPPRFFLKGKMITEIITAVITSGVVIGMLELVRDWKSKRKEAKTKAAKSDYETQKEGLDLVSVFYEKVKKLTDDGNDGIKAELNNIRADVLAVRDEQRVMAGFLNGEYQNYKKKITENGKGKNRETA